MRLPAGRVRRPGRQLRAEELVEVTWTIEAPEDGGVADVGERRRRQILRLLDEASVQGAAPTVDDLAEAIGASRSTVRRDMATLRQLGVALAHSRPPNARLNAAATPVLGQMSPRFFPSCARD